MKASFTTTILFVCLVFPFSTSVSAVDILTTDGIYIISHRDAGYTLFPNGINVSQFTQGNGAQEVVTLCNVDALPDSCGQWGVDDEVTITYGSYADPSGPPFLTLQEFSDGDDTGIAISKYLPDVATDNTFVVSLNGVPIAYGEVLSLTQWLEENPDYPINSSAPFLENRVEYIEHFIGPLESPFYQDILEVTGGTGLISSVWEDASEVCSDCVPPLPDGGLGSYTATHSTVEITLTVSIDIKPGSYPNSINPRSKGAIPVAILTTDTFDALQVDAESVKFGPAEATENHGQAHVEDVDGDGDMDLVLHFKTQETGIACGDTQAELTGETFDAQSFAGMDSIRIVDCDLTFTPVEWTIVRDTHGEGIHSIHMIADVSPLIADDLQDIGGELVWEETQITLCADPTYPPVEWGRFISIRDVGDGFLRIGDIFLTNGQGPGCDINTTMQNAFDDFGLPKNACLSVRSGDINYEFCAPLNVIQ